MNPLLIHGLLMGAGFGLMTSAGVVSRFLKRKRWWLKGHRALGIAGTVTLVPVRRRRTSSWRYPPWVHLQEPHTWLGTTAIALSWTAPVLCLLAFRIRAHAVRLRRFTLDRPSRPGRALLTALRVSAWPGSCKSSFAFHSAFGGASGQARRIRAPILPECPR